MSHSVDVAQAHEAPGVEHGKLGKGVAHVLLGEGTRLLWVLDELLTYKVPSQQTGGAYSLFEVITHPRGGLPQVHHREDESFYLLKGEYELSNRQRPCGRGRAPSSTSPRVLCMPTRT